MKTVDLEVLASKFYAKLENTNLNMPARVVAFSAVNGSGKTTITKFLESKGFLSPDPAILRELIFEEGYASDFDERNNIVLQFYKSEHVQKLKNLNNRSLVIDSNIDRNHAIFFNNYGDMCSKPFIIRIDLPLEVNLKRLKKRESNNPEALKKTLENLPKYIEDHEKFGKDFKDQISYRISGDITNEVLDDLYQAILRHEYN